MSILFECPYSGTFGKIRGGTVAWHYKPVGDRDHEYGFIWGIYTTIRPTTIYKG
jgi:hypothetical protein